MKSAKHRFKFLAITTLILIAGTLAWWYFLREQAAPKEIISLSGRIESDDAAVAAKTAGRIREITVREGDLVKAGQVIATLDDDQIKAREDQERAAVVQAESKVLQAQQEISVLEAQLQQSRLAVTQAQADSQGRVSQAQAEVAAAEADLARSRASFRQAQSVVAWSEADANRARSRLQEAQANRRDLEIVAPFAGTIATRATEPGEVVAAGAPIVTLVNLNQVYLRGFIPEGQIGRIRVGQPARIYLDSNAKQPLEAVVSRVDPQASFTPENTYFRDDRVKQVVGVKIQLTNPQGFAKPGMPADGEVLVEGNQWVASTRK
ncbi:MAG: HlyD family efflux transporter periplasmic adaptor subunit [Blastocatellia bacterium]